MRAGAAVDQAGAFGAFGATPLFRAAKSDHLGVVDAQVNAGASVKQALADGATPLYIPAGEGQRGHPLGPGLVDSPRL